MKHGFDGVERISHDDVEVDDIDDRMAGGGTTTIEQHPHHLTLTHMYEYACGGSVLTPTRRISAGQCFDRREHPLAYNIVAGSTSRSGDANTQLRPLTRFFPHPRYKFPFRFNDIAILFWKEPLTFGLTVQPIQLPQQNASVPYGEIAIVTGFGKNHGIGEFAKVLKSVQQPLISPSDCKRAYPNFPLTDEMLCAGGHANDSGPCDGDDGGALVSRGVIVGIVSSAVFCGKLNHPAVYTRVPSYVDWIRSNML